MNKTVSIRLDTKVWEKSKKRVIGTMKYKTYSDYLNVLIKNDLTQFGESELLESDENIKIAEEEDIKNQRSRRRLKKQSFLLLKDTEDIKRQVICIHFYDCSDRQKELHLNSIKDQINTLLDISSKSEIVVSLQKELKAIRTAIEENNEESLTKLCNLNQREKGLLFHLMIRYGIDARKVFKTYGVNNDKTNL